MKKILTSLLILISLAGCHYIDSYSNNNAGNFEALWTQLNEHYCFFREKDIDWEEVGNRYRARISPEMTNRELFDVCAEMLDELKDGHTNLSAPFNVSYYRKWWSDYPQNFDLRIIEEDYFNFNYKQAGGFIYGRLFENIAYIRYASFSSPTSESTLDYALADCASCFGLILDIRDNGGGSMTNVDLLAARFITERTLLGYISHKTGPGKDDFSKPYAYYLDPAPEYRIRWTKPVIILTNRSTFSAANNFVSIMQYLPNVRIVGDRTGGGSGMPFSGELPNGWGIRFSACSVTDARGLITENGIEPSEGCKVDMDPEQAARGIDTILEFAIRLLQK